MVFIVKRRNLQLPSKRPSSENIQIKWVKCYGVDCELKTIYITSEITDVTVESHMVQLGVVGVYSENHIV